MWNALWPALAALCAVSIGLLLVRVRQELTAIALDEAWIAFDERAPKGASTKGGAA